METFFFFSLFIPFFISLFFIPHPFFPSDINISISLLSGWFSPNTEAKWPVFDQKDYSVSATNTALHTGLNHKP